MVQQESQRQTVGLPETVSVLVVGDPGVGKTSLISSLVNGAFDPDVPGRLEEVTLKAELCPDNVSIRIVDTSEFELQDREGWRKAVKDTDVIFMVYTSGDEVSLDRISSYWIPTLRRCESVYSGNYKPKILVANKIDQLEEEKSLEMVSSVLQDCKDVNAFIEVSAKTLRNVLEAFYQAQRVVIYPIAPVFDPHSRHLTRKCRKALIDIFKLCDLDNDGLLNDKELNQFQEDCYGTPLLKDSLDDLKSIIKQSTTDGIVDNSITQEGFLFLHTLSIDKGRQSFTWQLLRKFNYDNQLEPIINSKILKLDDEANQSNCSHVEESLLLSIDDSKNQTCLTSNLSSSSNIEEEGEEEDIGREHFSGQVEVWLQDNKRIIKQSVGFTMATLVSMFALKFFVQNVIKARF